MSDRAERSFLATAKQGAEEVFNISERGYWEETKKPDFPKAVMLGPRTIRWVRAELESYAAGLPRVARDEPAQLRAARAAKAAGMTPAPAPFNGVVA